MSDEQETVIEKQQLMLGGVPPGEGDPVKGSECLRAFVEDGSREAWCAGCREAWRLVTTLDGPADMTLGELRRINPCTRVEGTP